MAKITLKMRTHIKFMQPGVKTYDKTELIKTVCADEGDIRAAQDKERAREV